MNGWAYAWDELKGVFSGDGYPETEPQAAPPAAGTTGSGQIDYNVDRTTRPSSVATTDGGGISAWTIVAIIAVLAVVGVVGYRIIKK